MTEYSIEGPSLLSEVRVDELVTSKQRLVDIEARSTCAEALQILDENKILSLPVWGQPGAWIGAGGQELVIGSKQYLGFVSIADIISFVLRKCALAGTILTDLDENLLPEALALPVFETLGQTNESLSLWTTTPDRSVLSTMEELCKGVHRILVLPPPDSVGAQLQAWTEAQAAKGRVLSQTDILRYLVQVYRSPQSSALDKLLASPLGQVHLGMARKSMTENKQLLSVNTRTNLILALYEMVDRGVHAVAVVDPESGVLVSTLSLSNFKGVVAGKLSKMHGTTVGDFLQRHAKSDFGLLPTPLTCDPDDSIIDILESMIVCKVHRSWVTDPNGLPVDVLTFTDLIKLIYKSETHQED